MVRPFNFSQDVLMLPRVCSGLFAAAIFVLLALPQPAAAAYPCPGGPGPGEVQVGVSGGSHGIAAVPMCESSGGGGDGAAVQIVNDYGSIAWHRDATDVWMVGNWPSPGIAADKALAACNRAMGGGCGSIGEWSNSSMAVIRDRNGILWNAWTGQGGAERKRVLAECSAKQLLPCEVAGTFSSRKRQHNPDIAAARKLYAFAAWVDGTEGFDDRLYIASGHRDPLEAERIALDACTKATARTCAILAVAGGGVIQVYRLGADGHSATSETSARRAAQAAQENCRKRGQPCALQRAYDSRTPGLFVHDFNAR